jgi:hypothetical protein
VAALFFRMLFDSNFALRKAIPSANLREKEFLNVACLGGFFETNVRKKYTFQFTPGGNMFRESFWVG